MVVIPLRQLHPTDPDAVTTSIATVAPGASPTGWREPPRQGWIDHESETNVHEPVSTAPPSSALELPPPAAAQNWEPSTTTKSFARAVLDRLPDELEGSYSLSRLAAFQTYRRTTSACWVCLVIAGIPFVPVLLVSTVLSIPLQNPQLGWKANHWFFLQGFVTCAIGFAGLQLQKPFYLSSTIRTTKTESFVTILMVSTVFVVVLVGLSCTVGFPVPFSDILPLVVCVPVSFAVDSWLFWRGYREAQRQQARVPERLVADRTDQQNHVQMKSSSSPNTTPNVLRTSQLLFDKCRHMIVFNFALLGIYPLYMVGFRRLTGKSQLAYMVLLPILKVALIEFARKRMDHVRDLVAASTVFSVELMNAMYSSLCMGGANASRMTSMVMIGTDALQISVSLVRLMLKTSRIVHLLVSFERLNQSTHSLNPQSRLAFDKIISFGLAFAAKHPQALARDTSIRVETSNGLAFIRQSSISRLLGSRISVRYDPSTTSMNSTESDPNEDEQRQLQQQLLHDRVQLVRETLAFVFAVEYVLLVEYVEAIIPFMLTVYHTIIFHGPNRQFNLDLSSTTSIQFGKSAANLLFYGGLELVSLMACILVLKWRFRLNVLSLLGFVLETHFMDIQGKMVFFLTHVLSGRFVHFGELCLSLARMAAEFWNDMRPSVNQVPTSPFNSIALQATTERSPHHMIIELTLPAFPIGHKIVSTVMNELQTFHPLRLIRSHGHRKQMGGGI